jgi:hypothetical protein
MACVSPIRVATILARMAKDALRGAVADVISRALEDERMRELVMLRTYWRNVEKLRIEYPQLSNARFIDPVAQPIDDYEIN